MPKDSFSDSQSAFPQSSEPVVETTDVPVDADPDAAPVVETVQVKLADSYASYEDVRVEVPGYDELALAPGVDYTVPVEQADLLYASNAVVAS